MVKITAAKAVTAGLVALLGALGIGLDDGALEAVELVEALAAGLAAGAATWRVENRVVVPAP